ncbi:MAG: apolipoprotein N-acyltransferase, partial [Planctomycetota bacterium]
LPTHSGQCIVQPNICVETAIERVTVNHTRRLIAQRTSPQVIVNITNDAWFDGTAILDHHVRCSQFVAIACRRPIVMASNTGPTLHINSSGRILQRLPYRTDGHLFVTPAFDGRHGLYLLLGDLLVYPLACLCLIWMGLGFLDWRKRTR